MRERGLFLLSFFWMIGRMGTRPMGRVVVLVLCFVFLAQVLRLEESVEDVMMKLLSPPNHDCPLEKTENCTPWNFPGLGIPVGFMRCMHVWYGMIEREEMAAT